MKQIRLILATDQPHEPLIVENNNGDIANQEFWEGRPKRLLGFVKLRSQKVLDIDYQTFYDNNWLAVGKYPVFLDNDGNEYLTESIVLESVIIEE